MNKPLTANYKSPYKNLIYVLMVALAATAGFSSCTTTKNSYYFKTIPRDTTINSADKRTEAKIRKADLLSILISSLNRDEDLTYNAAAISGSGTGATGAATNGGYLVDANGNIQVHRLGQIHAEGMTRRELKEKVQKDITPYLKDPIVTVRFLNRHVTILGEVVKPTVVPMPEERLTLLEVLGSSGDISATGKRDNILIIRETDNGKQFKRVNLEDHSIFTSDWYYMQPDDVVYVEPNNKKIDEEKRSRRQQTISMVLSGVSVAIIILDRIFR
jgi:polysaccharide export outer membrane protein